MSMESRILLILQFLYEKTDASHSVTTREIKRMLEAHGIPAPDTRTVESDIRRLTAAGHDIQRSHENGGSARYWMIGRDFDAVELKILMDAVAASRFIGPERTARILSRLAGLAGISDRDDLLASVAYASEIKQAVGGQIYVADTLYRAIVSRRQLRFQMIDYRAPDKRRVLRRIGKRYTVSPYAMIWNQDRYYLLCYEAKRAQILTPRVDRIRNAEVLEEAVLPPPEGFSPAHYYTESYKMFDGPVVEVTFECRNDCIGKFIDRFGLDFECESASPESFLATVRTGVSRTLFGWLLQYAGEIRPVAPEDVCREYRALLSAADPDLPLTPIP